jgi:lysophospholipase L1-like esterase
MLQRKVLGLLAGLVVVVSALGFARAVLHSAPAGLTLVDIQNLLSTQIAKQEAGYSAIVGDSITVAAPSQTLGGQKVLRVAYGGARIDGALTNLMPLMTDRPPTALIIAIGVNDAQRGIEKSRDQLLADVATNYRALLLRAKRLTPRVAVVLSPPVGRGQPMGDIIYDPALIVAINAIMQAVADELQIPVLALSALAGMDGFARPDTTLDGVHLSAAGYAIWSDVTAQAWQTIYASHRDGPSQVTVRPQTWPY